MLKISYYKSPVGILELTEKDNFLTGLAIVEESEMLNKKSEDSPLIVKVKKQLDEYFRGERFNFDLPINQEGTDFQKRAWSFLYTIPYGKTVSYKDEAEAIGSVKAVRAVGSANGANNIAIIVPCHRVVNSNGKLGGYAYGLPVKEQLLKMEQEFVRKSL